MKEGKEGFDKFETKLKQISSKSVFDFSLSSRAVNALKLLEVDTVIQLAFKRVSDFMSLRNFGKKSLSELQAVLSIYDLNFRPEKSGQGYSDPLTELMDKKTGTCLGINLDELEEI